MIRVCDSVMGSGKTTAAIRYMNDHPENKYIYIAPYKAEADRIQNMCPKINFYRPTFKVIEHSTGWVEEGRSLATTHQAFKLYTPELREMIRNQEYTLIIDESLDLLEEVEFSAGDLDTCIRAGYVKVEENTVKLVDDSYSGVCEEYKSFFSILRCRNLMRFSEGSMCMYYWILPPDLLAAFKDIIIMTYMFEGQEMSGLLKMSGLEYSYIGLDRDEDGTKFCEEMKYVPEYTKTLRNKIHILDHEKLNSVGCGEYALSLSWFQNPANEDKVDALKNHLYNYFFNIVRSTSRECMWSCYISVKHRLSGKGYTKGFVQFNARAENKYSSKKNLAYIPNVFMNGSRKSYLLSRGVDVDDDTYALSTMVQWIWRSAIRNGEDVNIYIPSRRMRELLINWMDGLAEGGANNDR